MSAKLLIIPSDMKLPPKLKKQIQEGGYIVVPEDRIGTVRVIEPLPDLTLTSDGDSAWLVQNMLDLIFNHSMTNQKEKLGHRMLQRLREKLDQNGVKRSSASSSAGSVATNLEG